MLYSFCMALGGDGHEDGRRSRGEKPGCDVNAAFDPGELSFRHQDKLLSSQISSSPCGLHDITFLLLLRLSLSITKDIAWRKNIKKNAQIDWQKKKKKRHYDGALVAV